MPNLKPTKIKAVLFDLGKVLFNFNFDPAFRRLAKKSDLSAREIEDFFVQSGLEVLYDSGKISSLAFYRKVKEVLRLKLGYAAFQKIWNDIFTPYPQMIRLLQKLRKKYRLVLISNTNAMHIEYLCRQYPGVFSAFRVLVLSYKVKLRKPDTRIYQKAIRACRVKPSEIFYIDDREDLTSAATALGLKTFTYRNNLHALLKQMKALAIL